MREQNGITLIALVLTVIILLILASVTIGTLIGTDGSINKTNKVIENYGQNVDANGDIQGSILAEISDIHSSSQNIEENRPCMITFINEDGTVLQKNSVSKGIIPIYNGTSLTKPATNEFTYSFSGWTPAIAAATQDQTYRANFTQTAREYTVAFKNWDGAILTSNTYHYGAAVTVPENPTRPADSNYIYTFSSWSPTVNATCTSNATYTATYTSVTRYFTVSYNNMGGTGTIANQQKERDIDLTLSDGTGFTKEGYELLGWDTSSLGTTVVYSLDGIYDVNSSQTLYAVWEKGVYGILYSNGVLAFNTTGNLAEGKTEDDVLVRSGNIKNTEFLAYNSAPWYANRATITTINFEEEISPISTAYWFYYCHNLTQINNISNLDTSQVTHMGYMFYYCISLTSIDVSGFDTSKVEDMSSMFGYCSSLTSIDVSGFDTSQVTKMYVMFNNCSSLTSIDVSGFDTSQVTNMYAMFNNCGGLTSIDVSGFDTSKVTHMGYMFYYCISLTSIDVSGFDTSKVEDMSHMFCGCSSLTSIDVSGFDTSQVTNMYAMFNNCSSLTSIDVSGFDTSQVTNMYAMFNNCRGLTSIDVSGFDTSQVTHMGYMFYYCISLTSIDVSGFDTSKVEDMNYMFCRCSSLTSLDVSGFDTSKVKDMKYMFYGCSGLTTIYASNLWTTGAVTSGDDMFYNCTSLVGQGGITYNLANIDVAMANYSGGYLTYAEPHLIVTPNTTESTSSVTVTMTKRASLTDYTIKYKIDDGVWQIYTAPITITSNCKVTARIENTSNEYLGTRRLNITNIV